MPFNYNVISGIDPNNAPKEIQTDISGNLEVVVLSGSGDASAANQTTEIARLVEIRDRLPSALISSRLAVDATQYNQFAAETQLTAPGTTTARDVSLFRNTTVSYTVASINTSVTVRLEGSTDGSNWFNLDPSENNTTITTNGTFAFILSNVALHRIRFNFVSEIGGTSATIDVRVIANG